MESEFQIAGYWWLAENPDNRIAGILNYKPNEEIDLKLLGDFESNGDYLSKHFGLRKEPSAIILGQDENANKITLVILSYGKKHWNLSGSFPIIHYKIRYSIKGVHLFSQDDNIFNEIDVELESLAYWMNDYPIRLSITTKADKLTTNFNLSYERPENNLSFNINEGFELSINPVATFTDVYNEEITVRQRHIALIKSAKPCNFSTLLEKSYRLQSFINMASFSSSNFLALRLYSDQHFQELSDNRKILNPIEVSFKQTDINTIPAKPSKNSQHLFTYQDVKEVFPELIKKWFAFDKRMMPILNHLIDSIQQRSIFKSVDFLIVMQALEGYHHRFFDNEPRKEKNLEQRLKNLINSFSKEILAARDINIKCAVDSRNYYSHFYERADNMRIAEGISLYNLTNKLRYLLICCLLHELGFDNESINEVIQKHTGKL